MSLKQRVRKDFPYNTLMYVNSSDSVIIDKYFDECESFRIAQNFVYNRIQFVLYKENEKWRFKHIPIVPGEEKQFKIIDVDDFDYDNYSEIVVFLN